MIDKSRKLSIDALRGIGIIFMVLGHCTIGNSPLLTNFIFSFHMPLFFLVSGYLYKNKPFSIILQSNYKRVIMPYLITAMVIGIFFLCKDGILGLLDWLLSIILANGSGTVFHLKERHVGPLWFLVAYFIAQIFLYLIIKIKGKEYQFISLVLLFVLSFIIKNKIGLLPLDILPAIIGCIFLYIGYNYIDLTIFYKKKIYLYFGLIIWISCMYIGGLSMASHVYKLNFLQIIGACYGTFFIYLLIKKVKPFNWFYKFLIFCGQNSLLILCLHSIDYNCHFSGFPYFLWFRNINNPFGIILIRFALKSITIYIGYLIVSRFKIIQSIFKIKKYPILY
jgi:fucose 4-O-acetylase-like acetyltransferase